MIIILSYQHMPLSRILVFISRNPTLMHTRAQEYIPKSLSSIQRYLDSALPYIDRNSLHVVLAVYNIGIESISSLLSSNTTSSTNGVDTKMTTTTAIIDDHKIVIIKYLPLLLVVNNDGKNLRSIKVSTTAITATVVVITIVLLSNDKERKKVLGYTKRRSKPS